MNSEDAAFKTGPGPTVFRSKERPMTFEEARAKMLARLDQDYQEVKRIVSDPQWNNPDHSIYKRAVEEFNSTLRDISRLNECQTGVEG